MSELLKPLRMLKLHYVRQEPIYQDLISVESDSEEVRYGDTLYVHRAELRVSALVYLTCKSRNGADDIPKQIQRAIAYELYGDLHKKLIEMAPLVHEIRMRCFDQGRELSDKIEELFQAIRP